MNIDEYIHAIANGMSKALVKGDHAEVIRLAKVLRDLLNDKIQEWETLL